MPNILIPIANGFEEIETMTVVDILRRAKLSVVLAGLSSGPVSGANRVNIIPDETLDTITADAFDMIVLPGGQPGVTNLCADTRIKRLLHEFNVSGKKIAAICAAIAVLSEAGIVQGKRVTTYSNCKERLDGALYVEKNVVCDDNIITSQGTNYAIFFALEIVSDIAGKHISDAIAADLLVKTGAQIPIWDQHLFNNIFQALVGAIELKDSYTQGHAKRVTEYSLAIGARLKFSPQEMRNLYLGAMLHDIGKVATEQDILNKADSLNYREGIIIREHPLKGALFIAGIDELQNIIPSILHHHERWDGNGYPAKLKGEQIPLHARIICITDSFAAMIFNRSFRPAMSKKQALTEVEKEKGSHFDPFLVDVLTECLNGSLSEMKDFSYYF